VSRVDVLTDALHVGVTLLSSMTAVGWSLVHRFPTCRLWVRRATF